MPLPFSFSTQRQTFASDTPANSVSYAVEERVMEQGPGQITTEPIFGTPGNTFSPPVLESSRRQAPDYPVFTATASTPPTRAPHQHVFQPSPNAQKHPQLVSATLRINDLPYNATHSATAPVTPVLPEWANQIDQLRNDVFGIAMGVSALNDRLDRLEQRVPQGTETVDSKVASLRSDIESWLSNHLNTAIEHCVQRYLSQNPSPASQPLNPNTP